MNPGLHFESHLRSVAKGFSYRFFGTLFTATAGFVMTGSTKTALLLGAAEFTFKVLLFWGHERLWARVRWGHQHRVVTAERSPARAPITERFAPSTPPPVLSLHASAQPIYRHGEG
jgi:uncharacterized membrane protein